MTKDMEAKAGDDYEATAGILLFEQGQKENTISVNIVDDEEFEPTERFCIVLSNPRLAEVVSETSSIKVCMTICYSLPLVGSSNNENEILS